MRRKAYQSVYLLSGPSGTGKTTLGRIFAKAILCDNPVDGNPCGLCNSCTQFDKEQNFSYVEIDAASVGGKDDMVKLRDEAAFQSVGKKKILLIDECHDISRQGQDALLKQLEQCPDHLIYIFCTTEPDSLKPTLRKRCMQFQASKIDPALITSHLKMLCDKESLTYSMDALSELAWLCQGHMRDAVNAIEEIAFMGEISKENLDRVFPNLDSLICDAIIKLGGDLKGSLEDLHQISTKISTREIYNQIIGLLSDAAKIGYGYEDLSPHRRAHAEKIRDIHGPRVLEFLSYLIQRDKYIDKSSIQSDAILLHYKFCSGGFDPKISVTAPQLTEPSKNLQVVESPNTTPKIPYAQFSKMGIKEKSQFLREQRMAEKEPSKDDTLTPKKVSLSWPLPKEERVGRNSFTEKELSPQEFSHNLVGGRGDVSR